MVQVASRIAVGIILLVSSIFKILKFSWFIKSVENYRILPRPMVRVVSLIIVITELSVGWCVSAGIFLPASIYVALCLLFGFSFIILITLARGLLDIDCGCMFKNTKVGWKLLLRNLGLIGLAWLSVGPNYPLLRTIVDPLFLLFI